MLRNNTIVYVVPEHMEGSPIDDKREWATKLFIKDHGKYALYVKGITDLVLRLRPEVPPITHSEESQGETLVFFKGAYVLSPEEFVELVKMLKEEPVEDLLLIRSKNPILAAVIDSILKGVS